MTRGLVALGDSITNGEGAPMLGVRAQSWALWLAAALGLPYTGLATDGARSADVARDQLPRLAGPYDLACVYVGVNDVRDPGFDLAAYAAALATVLRGVRAQAARTLVCTIPLDLGRPRAGHAKVGAADAVIRREAAAQQMLVVGLEDLGGWRTVLPDAVHLTAWGQLELARRAAAVLGAGDPGAGVTVQDGPRALAHYALAGRLPAAVRDGLRRARERSGRPGWSG